MTELQFAVNYIRVPMVRFFKRVDGAKMPGLWYTSRKVAQLIKERDRWDSQIDRGKFFINGFSIDEPKLFKPLEQRGIKEIKFRGKISAPQFRRALRAINSGFLTKDKPFFYSGLGIFQNSQGSLYLVDFNPANLLRFYAELSEQNTLDPLTGIGNLRYFKDNLDIQFNSTHRNGHVMARFIFDLNSFKNINDTYGHPVGDAVLKSFAQVLKSVFKRKSDIVCRIGGDEFAVIIPTACKTEDAERLLAELATLLASLEIPYKDSQGQDQKIKGMSFSCGYGFHGKAHYDQGETDEEAFKTRVDEALYYAKKNKTQSTFCAASPVGDPE